MQLPFALPVQVYLSVILKCYITLRMQSANIIIGALAYTHSAKRIYIYAGELAQNIAKPSELLGLIPPC